MSIVDKIDAYSGTNVLSKNIEDALSKLPDGAISTESLNLVLDVDIADDTDLLGKVVSDLQSNIKIWNDQITGHLKYVTEYTEFSGDPDEQEGHYIALHASVTNVDGATVKINNQTLDSDGIIILILNKAFPKVIVEASKEGYRTVRKQYTMNSITLEPKA